MGENDEDAELYNPPDQQSKSPDNKEDSEQVKKEESDVNGESSKPMLTRQSVDGAAFSIGDDEFGNWADDDDDDDDDER
jgi:hypothetical protein